MEKTEKKNEPNKSFLLHHEPFLMEVKWSATEITSN